MKPEVIIRKLLSMQVCVPADYTDEQVKDFADTNNVAGTTHGWQIRREGDAALMGDDEREPCLERCGCVHIMLDC